MVKFQEPLDRVFFALSDSTRRDILARLAAAALSVAQLAGHYQMTMPGLMKHIAVLESAGLVTTEKSGRVRTCRLAPESLRDASLWIEHYRRFWDSRLDQLETFLLNEEATS